MSQSFNHRYAKDPKYMAACAIPAEARLSAKSSLWQEALRWREAPLSLTPEQELLRAGDRQSGSMDVCGNEFDWWATICLSQGEAGVTHDDVRLVPDDKIEQLLAEMENSAQ
jgi:hypothetical protein